MTDAWFLKQPIYMIKIQPVTGSSQPDLRCAFRPQGRRHVKLNFLLEISIAWNCWAQPPTTCQIRSTRTAGICAAGILQYRTVYMLYLTCRITDRGDLYLAQTGKQNSNKIQIQEGCIYNMFYFCVPSDLYVLHIQWHTETFHMPPSRERIKSDMQNYG